MRNNFIFILLSVLLCLVALPAGAEELAQDILIGRVPVGANMRLNASSKKAIAAAAAKIKKANPGTVKLLGSYMPAETEDEYLTKSVLAAREVAQYLKKLLPAKQQIYTLFSPYSNENLNKQVVVDILLYPKVLREANVEIFNSNTLQGKPAGQVTPKIQPQQQNIETHIPAQTDEVKSITYGSTRQEEPAEDAMRANDLVRRAKERAADRARRMKDAD